SARFSARENEAIAFIQARSAPAQNAAPRPPSTITRTPSIERRANSVLRSSVTISPSNALRASGRVSQPRAAGPAGAHAARRLAPLRHPQPLDPVARLGPVQPDACARTAALALEPLKLHATSLHAE